ncbi:hypothetical protein CYLTODRAFT_363870 [Cylindrobasidium torrendii FP15055 ss-10]|uniref:Uncharacterized protein n=1 Tax=Cylindrobasidium torrendii FP15055 ss-10 TaxID=1314674 RepID=A0A0D7AQR5_9AGAR|nr:hypothetical protein CYLTODRAFT_363870 [Cylindrobasidium torrendii FP15055 ss-10]
MLFVQRGVPEKKRARGEAWSDAAIRPQIVGKWVGGGRCRGPRQQIQDLREFKKRWTEWYRAIQPDWRAGGRVYGADWSKWTSPGQNGILSIVACLSWWREKAGSDMDELAEWRENTEDVQWMLTGLYSSIQP